MMPNMPEFDITDEDELQKRELQRLLSTAQDEERKEYIRKALSALETHEQSLSGKLDRANPHHLNPAIHASVFLNHGLPIIETRNARMRPMSARRRTSSSNLLDAIPESLHQSNRKEMELSYEEVAEVVGSSFDPKCPSDMLFKHIHSASHTHTPTHNNSHLHPHPHHLTHSPSFSSIPENSDLPHNHTPPHISHAHNHSHILGHSHTLHKPWVSTGLTPQFLSLTFYEQWLIRRVEVRAHNIEQLAVHINFSTASTYSSAKLIQLVKKAEDRFEAEVVRPRSSESTLDASGVHGVGLMLVIQKTSGIFCSIHNIRVVVVPNR